MKNPIEVSVLINSTLEKVWNAWTKEEFVKIWNVPFADWHCPSVKNDVRTDGDFNFRMEKLDGSEGFDYKGRYLEVIPFSKIETLQEDGRKSLIIFKEQGKLLELTEQFEPEAQTELSLQKEFCQSVLNKFKDFVENLEG